MKILLLLIIILSFNLSDTEALVINDDTTMSYDKCSAKFEEAFTLKREQCVVFGDELEVELTMLMQEWGYTGPPQDKDREWFGGDIYMLTVKIGDGPETLLDFYESEQLESIRTIEIENYTIHMLSSDYSASEIEVVVTKK